MRQSAWPPTTAVASEAREAEPSPLPRATGNMPAMMASVVMRIGRSRARSACICASSRPSPRPRSTLV